MRNFMPEQRGIRSWTCDRDPTNPHAPYCTTLSIGDETIASGRGINEVDAYAALIDVLSQQGIADGRILGMQELMRRR
jgi:hypothetical protein